MKMLIAIALLLSSIGAHAEYADYEKKFLAIISTVVGEKDSDFYKLKMADIPDHEHLIVSKAEIENFMAMRLNLTEATFVNAKSPLGEKIRKMIAYNNLNEEKPDYHTLRASEHVLINIVYLMDLQDKLSNRNDLSIFGTETVQNLNAAIYDRVQALYLMAEKFWITIPENVGPIELMKRNLINIGLEFEQLFSVGDPWLDRFIETSNAEAHYPLVMLNSIMDLNIKQTDLKLKKWMPASECKALFL